MLGLISCIVLEWHIQFNKILVEFKTGSYSLYCLWVSLYSNIDVIFWVCNKLILCDNSFLSSDLQKINSPRNRNPSQWNFFLYYMFGASLNSYAFNGYTVGLNDRMEISWVLVKWQSYTCIGIVSRMGVGTCVLSGWEGIQVHPRHQSRRRVAVLRHKVCIRPISDSWQVAPSLLSFCPKFSYTLRVSKLTSI